MIDRWTNLEILFPDDVDLDILFELFPQAVGSYGGDTFTFVVVVPDEVDQSDFMASTIVRFAEAGAPPISAELVAASDED